MYLDMMITINSKPDAYDVLYKVFDADGLLLRRGAITYIAKNIKVIVNDLLNDVKPTSYKLYADDVLISQLKDE
jgi:hypothetical protein